MKTNDNAKSNVSKRRKRYEKPAVIHRELMESVAGACDSQDPVNGKAGIYFCLTINS